MLVPESPQDVVEHGVHELPVERFVPHADDYRRNWEQYALEWCPGPLTVETRDLYIAAGWP